MATDGRPYQELLYTPAIIVASVTAVLYLVGYIYYIAFFNRLSIPYGSIDLSLSQCITAALPPISSLVVVVMAIFVFYSPKFKNKFEETKVRTISLLILIFLLNIIYVNRQTLIPCDIIVTIAAIILIILVLIVFLFIISFFPKLLPFFIASTVFILFQTPNDISTDIGLSMVVVLSKMSVGSWILFETYMNIKSTESEILSTIHKISDTKMFPMFLIAVLFVVCCFSTMMGFQKADDMIAGVSSDALKINIDLKDENNTMFENKTLILVMVHDDTYYIIEKDENYLKNQKLHIIPSHQIKMVVVYEKGRGRISHIITSSAHIS